MTQLTENQNKVIDGLKNGHNSIESLVTSTGLAKRTVIGTLTSLLKSELIVKEEDDTYSINGFIEVAGDDQETENQERNDVQPIQVLIPYLKSEAAGDELKIALRALQQNLKMPFEVVIIGDQEDWFSPEITYIPHEQHLVKEVCNCPAPAMIRNPQADVNHKIFTAISSGIISGNFILSNDDIFLLAPTYPEDIGILKAFRDDLNKTGTGTSLYAQNNLRAAKALAANSLPSVRYGTHTPMLFNADKLLEIIEKYNCLENGYPIESLYFNELYPDARPLILSGDANDSLLASAYRADIPKNVLDNVFKERKFLNSNSKGWISIKEHLEEAFPNPSRYEL
ncbi:hypothetical protein [Sphingobacterium lactis]|uniref:Uncharacterized protein n=1 Tax=Sphingobacterium lactis TaxID=797291 RepID=A0A1H6BPY8_9SPHI|nr:hypothetical protein [Sphingobacterium lactis]SEG62761.1 hypothetical protein SAMN05421877_11151 [Sphingobacterium lactis]